MKLFEFKLLFLQVAIHISPNERRPNVNIASKWVLAKAEKAQQADLAKDQDYSGWVGAIPEDKWAIFQSKKGITSKNHGECTVFSIAMLEDLPPIAVEQKDSSSRLKQTRFLVVVFVVLKIGCLANIASILYTQPLCLLLPDGQGFRV